jgi:predicted nuclease of predicted toxin-antitoxin system
MRLLLDNNLSPKPADLLRAASHDVVHMRDIGMANATDPVVIDVARAQGRVPRQARAERAEPR